MGGAIAVIAISLLLGNRCAIALGDSLTRISGVAPDVASASAVAAQAGSAITYEGGPVLNANRTHVIFWDPAGSGLRFDPGYTALVQQFLADVAADSHMTSNEYAVTGEYADSAGPAAYASTYGGSVLDTDVLPVNGCTEPVQTGPGWSDCVTDAQLQDELEHVLRADRLPAGGDNIYLIVTPNGLGSCEDAGSSACALGGPETGYCGYHSSTDAGTLYAVIPYNAVPGHCQPSNPRPNASTADPALSTISHEQAETITDPLGNAWISANGDEIGDVCLSDFGPALGGSGASAWDESINGHHYWLQELYGRVQGGCVARPAPDAVWIAGSGQVRAGAPVTFGGHGRMPGGSVGGFLWSLGDGVLASSRVVSHVFARAGAYKLRLRITDSAGNWAYATRSITVVRPPARGPSRATRRRAPARTPAAQFAGSAQNTSRVRLRARSPAAPAPAAAAGPAAPAAGRAASTRTSNGVRR